MAIKGKKKEEAKDPALEIKVTRAKDFSEDGKTTIAFDMVVNGVTIYGCYYREGTKKDGSEYAMIAFPSRKDAKSDKYYNHAYVKLSDADVENIASQIEDFI